MAAVLAAPVVLALGFFILWRTALPDGDSPCYLDWCPKRTSLYPLFLDAFEGPLLLPLQMGLFAATASWLGWLAQRLFGSLLLTSALVLGTSANPYVWQLQGSIMSEALTTPLLVLQVGLTAAYLVKDRPAIAVLAAACAGLMAATRPALLPLVIVPVVAIWLSRSATRRKVALTAASLAAWLIPVGADHFYKNYVFGADATSVAGSLAFAKAAIIEAEPLDRTGMSATDRKLADVLEKDFEPVRQLLAGIRGTRIHDAVRLNYEVCIQFACGEHAVRHISPPSSALDDALLRVGTARLRQNLPAYLALAADEYRGLWLLHPRKHPSLAHEHNAFLRSAGPLPFQEQLGAEFQPVTAAEQKSYYRINRIVFIALGFGLVLAGLILLWRVWAGRAAPASAGFALFIGIQAVLVFAALFGVGIPRYTMGLWPAIIFCIAIAAYSLAAATDGARRPQ